MGQRRCHCTALVTRCCTYSHAAATGSSRKWKPLLAELTSAVHTQRRTKAEDTRGAKQQRMQGGRSNDGDQGPISENSSCCALAQVGGCDPVGASAPGACAAVLDMTGTSCIGSRLATLWSRYHLELHCSWWRAEMACMACLQIPGAQVWLLLRASWCAHTTSRL